VVVVGSSNCSILKTVLFVSLILSFIVSMFFLDKTQFIIIIIIIIIIAIFCLLMFRFCVFVLCVILAL
jgi:hypothetical protein